MTEGAKLGVKDAEPVLFVGYRAILFLGEDDIFRAELGPLIGSRRGRACGFSTTGSTALDCWCGFAEEVDGDPAGEVMDRIERYA